MSSGSLYDLFGLSRDASPAQVRKAYHTLALRLHPDKQPAHLRDGANDKFQSLQRAFAVLSDPEKRRVYDRTGSLEDSEQLAGEQFDELYQYYRNIYKEVTEDDILAFEKEYRGSTQEKNDLLDYYGKFQGNMNKVFAWLCCSRPEVDSHRFMDVIDAAIEEGTLDKFPQYAKWARATSKRKRPARDPLKPQKPKKALKNKASSMNSLVMQIQANKGGMQNLISSLEEKYAKKDKKKKKTKAQEPSDEEFEKIQKRLLKKKSSK